MAIKYSKISFVFIPDIIKQPVRILGGKYKWIIFPRQSFYDRKVSSSFQVGVGTMRTLGLSTVFKFLPLYR